MGDTTAEITKLFSLQKISKKEEFKNSLVKLYL